MRILRFFVSPVWWIRIVILSLTLNSLAVFARNQTSSSNTFNNFALAAPQGFGDRQNSWAWSMTWWRGHLYVGTNRAFHCVEAAALNRTLGAIFPGLFPYPPVDPDMDCAANPEDLPLQAEIWRWLPNVDTWQRVYRSPMDIPIPGKAGKLVARDIAFRGLSVFVEPDGTEALYAAGVGPSFLWPQMPPPRILRSVDGVSFEAVPQEPGTTLGDLPYSSLRNQISFQDRFYVVGGTSAGSGELLEAENPAGGNDNFRVVSHENQVVSAVQGYNEQLYVGLRSLLSGYSIVKTTPGETAPYTYTTVIGQGGYLPGVRSLEVLSMKEFGGRLYAGTNGIVIGTLGLVVPAEVVRINPDDSWDLVVGDPRSTPDGWKYPISGFDGGFGHFFNGHMWRMEVYQNNLFIGTFDSSTTFKDNPAREPELRSMMGFDLYRTPNGVDFFPVTLNGFGDKFSFGVRSMTATPYGLFVGSANFWYGLQIWRSPLPRVGGTIPPSEDVSFLPVIRYESAGSLSSVGSLSPASLGAVQPPKFVQTDVTPDGIIISWEQSATPQRYRVMRSTVTTMPLPEDVPYLGAVEDPELVSELIQQMEPRSETTIPIAVWTEPEAIGSTSESYFVDRSAIPGQRYVYYVQTESGTGDYSLPSNLAPAPSAAAPATFGSLEETLHKLASEGNLTSEWVEAQAYTANAVQDSAHALHWLAELRTQFSQPGSMGLPAWKAEDLNRLLNRLERRVQLVEAGLLDLAELE